MKYPPIFLNLLENFKAIPGVGEKSAERYLFALLEMEESDLENFSENLIRLKKEVKQCKICNCYTDKDICDICDSKHRNSGILCVVEDSKSVFKFENVSNYNGKYYVIDGLISPREGINPEDINVDKLINNRIDKDIKEIILALSPSIEGETTSLYIKKLLENKKIKISRLSYGIPIGTDIEYLDPIIIEKALEDRKYLS